MTKGRSHVNAYVLSDGTRVFGSVGGLMLQVRSQGTRTKTQTSVRRRAH